MQGQASDRAGHAGRRAVVVAGGGSLGDLLQITPLLAALRERFPGHDLVLVHTFAAAGALLEGLGLVDSVVLQRQRAAADVARTVMSWPCDLIVETRYVVTYIVPPGACLDARDLAFVEAARARQAPWLPLLQKYPLDSDLLWRRAVAGGLNLYRLMAYTAGFEAQAPDFEQLRVALPPNAHVGARDALPPRYIVLANAAEGASLVREHWTKTLPPAKMDRIAGRLRGLGLPLVHLGVASVERPIVHADIDLRGRTTIAQAAAILRDAAGFVVPEGGLSNLARAVGTRGVVFFGSTPADFFGFRDNINIRPRSCGGCFWSDRNYLFACPRLQREPECVSSLDEDEIVNAVGMSLSLQQDA